MIQKIQSKPLLAVVFITVVGVLIFGLSMLLTNILMPVLPNFFASDLYTRNIIIKGFILLFSLGAIFLLNNGTLEGYGFIIPKKVNYLKLGLVTIGLSIFVRIVGTLLFIFLLNTLFPMGTLKSFTDSKSIIQAILIICIWSSLAEEVFVRGLIQSFLVHLKSKKLFKLSVPVIISGLLFGAMHLSLLATDMSFWFVCFTVFFTSTMGIFIAYQREKTESLLPAFYIHFIVNFISVGVLIVKMLMT